MADKQLSAREAALIIQARAKSERVRRRQRMLYLWIPFAFMSVTGVSTPLWSWHKL